MNLPPERTWRVITDLERVAPCRPGAALLEVDGNDHRGLIKIEVGPVATQCEGVARFMERNDGLTNAVIRAEGRDIRGQGNAAATVDLWLQPHGSRTAVRVETELAMAERVAQFRARRDR